jgi:hypothetical protein
MELDGLLMATSKTTFEKFAKEWNTFDDKVLRQAIASWNANTLLAMNNAQFYSPVKTGNLQGSARRRKAKITPTGITSEFIFAEPYAFKLEKDVNPKTGKELNINTSINPNARKGYAAKGVEEQEDFFMRDLDKAIGKAFQQLG